MALARPDLDARAQSIRLILLDVDGVLTDGTLSVSAAGDERQSFFVRDGSAIVWAQRAGIEVGLLSGRAGPAAARRAAELQISTVLQGVRDKRQAFVSLTGDLGLQPEHVAYMGDDLMDLPVLELAGLSAAPSDACAEVRDRVHFVAQAAGGRGAVREFIELILHGSGRWDAALRGILS